MAAEVRGSNFCASVVLVAALAAGVVGCKRAPPEAGGVTADTTSADAAPGVPAILSDAEQLYGVSPRRVPGVTYQPNVILMEHGANAIRSQSLDGFTWTIDAAAPGAMDIRPDKILFATGRVVGRVLKVTSKGGDLDVTLGPAELTDIFQEVHIATQGSLDPEKMLVYVAPSGYPGASHDRDEPEASPAARAPDVRDSGVRVYAVSQAGDMVPVHSGARIPRRTACGNDDWGQFHVIRTSYVSPPETVAYGADDCAQFTRVGVGTTAAAIADVVLDGFSITPSMTGGLQAATKYNHGGLIFNAHTKIRLEHPKFKFRLDILHGLKTAAIEFSGVGGIEVGIEAGLHYV